MLSNNKAYRVNIKEVMKLNIGNLPSSQGIYKIECLANGKIYIGQSVDIRCRANEHRRALEKKAHNNDILQNSYNKYGKESFRFSLVEKIKNREDLTDREKYWADYYNCFDLKKGFNICKIVKDVKRGVDTSVIHAKKVMGSNNGNSKLLEKQVIEICKLLNEGKLSCTEIAKRYGVTYKTITHIRNGARWDHLSALYLKNKITNTWKKAS